MFNEEAYEEIERLPFGNAEINSTYLEYIPDDAIEVNERRRVRGRRRTRGRGGRLETPRNTPRQKGLASAGLFCPLSFPLYIVGKMF